MDHIQLETKLSETRACISQGLKDCYMLLKKCYWEVARCSLLGRNKREMMSSSIYTNVTSVNLKKFLGGYGTQGYIHGAKNWMRFSFCAPY
jgi:hypothetical protein